MKKFFICGFLLEELVIHGFNCSAIKLKLIFVLLMEDSVIHCVGGNVVNLCFTNGTIGGSFVVLAVLMIHCVIKVAVIIITK